ncbi:hypothetical protein GGX14DRAFT_403391 [Mycena pura]|uniref:Uncharacterized protein n=1 Tax=Mycena pura TaxID=153505 RepID=A0AAD6UY85_9AGAR|nr:hypothetical protein GGX14DRAFT_403391 [Mycena pura]
MHLGVRIQVGSTQLTTVKSELQDPTGDMQTLLDNLASAVRTAFQKEYTYAYIGASSLPPSALKNQDGQPVKLVPGEDFTICAYNSLGSISTYVDTNVVNGNTPIWAQATLRNFLIGYLQTILGAPATNSWVSSPQPKTVTGGANNETLEADITLLYCVTNAPDPKNPGQIVKTLFCKYIGVYYLRVGPGIQSVAPIPESDPVPDDTAQVLAIDCGVSNATLATALGAQIIRTQPYSVNTVVNVTSTGLSVVVAAKCATEAPGFGQPISLPLEWCLDILKENNVTYSQKLRPPTSAEYQELQYLDRWDSMAAFKRGDFSSLQY